MVYAQYFNYGVISKELIEACGDRSVVILDGRQNEYTWHIDAVECNGFRRPKYPAYQLWRGRNFSDSQPISKVVILSTTHKGE